MSSKAKHRIWAGCIECLFKLEAASRKRLLHCHTHPVTIYACKIMTYDILSIIDYYLLSPIVITSTLLIFLTDNIEIWIRLTLRLVQFYSFCLRKTMECSAFIQAVCTNKLMHCSQYVEHKINAISSNDTFISSSHNNSFSTLLIVGFFTFITYLLKLSRVVLSIQFYLSIPVLFTMNKTNAFTIRIQQSEIKLLQTKSQCLSQKNQWLSTHVSLMEQRKIHQYNVIVAKRMQKYLRDTLPKELIRLIAEFAAVRLGNDCVKINWGMRTRQRAILLKTAAKMDHVWIWRRYQAVSVRRDISKAELAAWYAVYYWLLSTSVVSECIGKGVDGFCRCCAISRHTLKIIVFQTAFLLLGYFYVIPLI